MLFNKYLNLTIIFLTIRIKLLILQRKFLILEDVLMKLMEDTICEKNLYKGKVIELYLQKVRLSNGKYSNREIVKHPGGVAIIAFKDKETILMVEQYRNGFN